MKNLKSSFLDTILAGSFNMVGKAIFFSLLLSICWGSSVSAQRCTVQLNSIKCIEPEGFFTADNIYLKLNNNRIWQQQMVKGSELNLNGIPPISFNEKVSIQLWDDDTFDDDDYLGNINPDFTDAGHTTKERVEGDGAIYEVIYTVKIEY